MSTMHEPSYDRADRDTPYGRGHPEEMPCPWCGGRVTLLSFGDDATDDVRVEFYCNNPRCEVREWIALPMRMHGRIDRADVQALEAVDAYNRPQLIGGGEEWQKVEDAARERRKRPATFILMPSKDEEPTKNDWPEGVRPE
jgi:hypothetical protein